MLQIKHFLYYESWMNGEKMMGMKGGQVRVWMRNDTTEG